MREHLETFLAEVQARTGTGLPEFVRDEFEAFLECGILAHGFLRVRCADCAHEKLVAFSCKRRGFCPSCGTRRMAESAAVLVDEAIPRVPVRQWVLSFPIGLRIIFAARPELLTPVLRLIHRVRFHGVLAPNAGLRATVVPGPPEKPGDDAAHHAHGVPARMCWARLLKRVFDLDLEHCPQCGGEFRIIAAIEEPAAIVRILTHLGLPARAPPRSPARGLPLFQVA